MALIPSTPEQWLAVLAGRLDARQGRLQVLRDYLNGNPPLPEGAVNDTTAYRDFQRKSRTNFAELVVDAVAERMRVGGFQVGTDSDDDDAARAVWRQNMLEVGAADLHRDMLAMGVSYAVIAPDRSVMVESPEFCITDDDPRTKLPRAGLIVWRDAAAGKDYADLLLPATVQRFARAIPDPSNGFTPKGSFHDPLTGEFFSDSPVEYIGEWTSSDWQPENAPARHGFAEVPIVKFANRDEVGEFERHLDVLDRINWGLLQRLVITATQAWKQRAIKGELPTHDAEGVEIDYSAVFAPGAGALWTLPDGVDIWESPADRHRADPDRDQGRHPAPGGGHPHPDEHVHAGGCEPIGGGRRVRPRRSGVQDRGPDRPRRRVMVAADAAGTRGRRGGHQVAAGRAPVAGRACRRRVEGRRPAVAHPHGDDLAVLRRGDRPHGVRAGLRPTDFPGVRRGEPRRNGRG